MPALTPLCEVREYKESLDKLPKLLADNDGHATVLLEWGGIPAAGNIICNRRALYRLLGVEQDPEAYRRILEAVEKPREPSEDDMQEYYATCERVNLPAVRFYECDGGPYLTGSIIIACHGGVCNASIHRMMKLSDTEYAVRIVPRHLYRMLKEAGGSIPAAVVLGAHPLVEVAAATSPPYGVFELNVAAGLGWNGRVCHTPRYGIPVPCDAGVILEGRLGPETAPEGPFADILLLCDRVREQPVFRIEACYVRRDGGIVWQVLPGGEEHKLLMGFPREALVWDAVRRATGREPRVRLLSSTGGWLAAAIAFDDIDVATAKIALMAAFAAHPSLKMAIVTLSDIDIEDDGELLWAMATRIASPSDILIVPEARVSTLDPSSHDGVGVKIGIVAVPRGERDRFRRARLAG